jgi:heptosyltransferase-2
MCSDCPCFAPRGERILIIKLGAPGDVLRTTCLLPGLKQAHPDSHISWLTRPVAAPLLANNPFLDEIILLDAELAARLAIEEFDRVLSLDSSPDGACLASCSRAPLKRGFGCNPQGPVYPLNTEAEEWFLMGIFDPVKQANRKSYPQIVHDIVGLSWTRERPVLVLTDDEQAFAARFARERGLSGTAPVIGLFTSAGRRWQGKAWPEAGFAGLIELLLQERAGQVLLLGGPDEAARNARLLQPVAGRIVDGGCGNTLREFAALVSLCDLVVTADTLALHVATALAKKVVVLVGPTSAAEIELYGAGAIVSPDDPCRCYYQAQCSFSPSCLQTIPPERVFAVVQSLL